MNRKLTTNDGFEESNEHSKCRDCGSLKIVENSSAGNIYCLDCGLEHHSLLIDYHSEWRKSTETDKYHDDSTRSTLLSNTQRIGSDLITSLLKADAQYGFQIRCNSTEKRWESGFKELEKNFRHAVFR